MQRSLSMIKRFALFLVALILLGSAIVFALLGTSGGRNITAGLIGSIASSNDLKVEIIGLNSVLGNRIEIEQLAIADRDGVWATTNSLKVDYRLTDLMFGKIIIDDARIETVSIDRLPLSPQNSAPSNPLAWPTQLLPAPFKSLDLSGFAINNIGLATAVTGKPATLSLSGHAQANNTPLGTSGTLAIQQVDNAESSANGSVLATWNVDPAKQAADISLEVAEDRDGLIANLLNIPDRPAIKATLAGSGPLSNWSSKLAVAFNDRPVVSGEAIVALTSERQSIDATLSGQLAPLLPKSILPLVAGNTDIRLNASRDATGNIQIDAATLKSALAQVQSRGVYSPTQNRVDMTANIEIGNEGEIVSFERQPGVITQLGRVNFTSKINGTVNDATLSLSGEMASFEEGQTRLADARLDATSEHLDLANMRGGAVLNLYVAELATGTEPADQLVAGGLTIASEVKLAKQVIDITSLSIKSAALSSLTIGRHDLAAGNTQLASKTSITGQKGSIVGQLFGDQTGIIEAEIGISSDGQIDAKSISVKSANLNASGSGTLNATDLKFDGNLVLANLANFNPELAGALELTAAASGSTSSPSINLELLGDKLAVAGRPIDGLSGTISGSLQDAIAVQLDAVYEDAPITASANIVSPSDGPRKIDALKIVVPGGEISGAVTVGNNGLMAGFADLRFSDFAKLAPLILQTGLDGSANGRVELFVENGAQGVVANISTPALNYDDAKLTNLELRASASDLFGNMAPKVNVQIGALSVAGETLNNTAIDVSSNLGVWPITLTSELSGKPLSVSAVVDPRDEKLALNVEQLDLNYRSIPISLSKPIVAMLDGGVTTLSAPSINLSGGQMAISGKVSDQFDVDVQVSNLSMSAIEGIAKTGFAPIGTIDASAKVSGPIAAPNVAYRFEGRNLSGAPIREAGLASLNVNGSGNLKNNQLSTSLAVSGGGLDIAVSGTTDLKAQSLDFAVKGVAPFAYAARPLTQSGVVLSGSVNIDATATGSFAKPNVQGQISTSGARFTEIASRIRVTDLSGTLLFNGDSANLSQLTGRLGKNGKLTASGNVSLRPTDKLLSELSLSVRNAEYDDGSIISTIFDADLSLNGRLAETGSITGTISVDRTDITIPESLPNVISPVAVTHKNASAAINEQSRALNPTNTGGAGPSMSLNILVNAPNRIFVRGRGLDAELGGNLKIEGTAAAPIAKGAISMSRGRMDILTKRFDFDTGRLVFAGPLDPTLDFVASTRDGGSTYSIFVRGPASAPEFSFGSSPSLPQDQIVAKLFFGRSLSDLSALQLVQLANAIGTLNGSNSGPGLLDRLRAASGLDDVDIKTNEKGETTVGVGAYLNDRTYINVEKGAGAGSGKVTIDLNITDNITARGETTEDGKTKAGVFFEQDY